MAGENRRRFPPEIEEEILINLPVKSLNRFRCVLTSWQSLISEHRFVRKHLTRPSQPDNVSLKTLIMINPEGSSDEKLCCFPLSSLPMKGGRGVYHRCPFKGEFWKRLGSYDGLLCIWVDRSIYIWNPCLPHAYRKVLSPTGTPTFGDTYLVGLGYDSMMDDYKLFKLSINEDEDEDTVETEIYSLKSDSWRKLDNLPYDYYRLRSCVFVNGSFHFLAFDYSNFRRPCALFSFDLAHDKFREVSLPDQQYRSIDPSLLDVELCFLQGMLCFLVQWNSCLDLWAMKDYSDCKSWTKFFFIQSELVFGCFHDPASCKPFHLHENGEVLMEVISEQRKEMLICKDDEVLSREMVYNKPYTVDYGLVHVESLISPLPVAAPAITRKEKLRH